MPTKNEDKADNKEKKGNKGRKLPLSSDKKTKDLNTSDAYNIGRIVVAMPTTRFNNALRDFKTG